MKIEISLQTKQTISQVQMQSLEILTMSMTELQEFLQKEEIENPLIEYKEVGYGTEPNVAYRDVERFYAKHSDESGMEYDLYEGELNPTTLEDLIITQLPWSDMGSRKRRIIEFCTRSLNQSGYLPLQVDKIADSLKENQQFVEQVLSELKELEPRGIFAANLEECLLLQVKGMEQEILLERIIREHLNDVADGKISSISRALKLSSAEVRKLLQVIKKLNPRPLNGFGEDRTQYIIPDIILSYHDNQWTISLNDKWTGSFGIDSFYVQMMETVQDEELKAYFEEKLRRARFIVDAVEQRRATLIKISERILAHQEGFFLSKDVLKPMTMEMIAEECGIHKSTVSRAIREKWILVPRGCLLIRDLFTSGIASKTADEESISRNAVKDKLQTIILSEDKTKPYSDEQIVEIMNLEGISISRRTVAKYRSELGIPGVFQRKEV